MNARSALAAIPAGFRLPEPAYTITVTSGPAAGHRRVVRAIRLAVRITLSAAADAMVAVACHGRLPAAAACITLAVAVLTVGIRDGSGKEAP